MRADTGRIYSEAHKIESRAALARLSQHPIKTNVNKHRKSSAVAHLYSVGVRNYLSKMSDFEY